MHSLYFNCITYTNVAHGDSTGDKSMAAGTISVKRKKSSISSETTNAKGTMFSGERDSVPSATEMTTGSDAADRGSNETDTSTNPRNRYILFVGNLPYDASAEDILTHFERRGVPMKDIRLLTEKESGKSRGIAFAEFDSAKRMQVGLGSCHTELSLVAWQCYIACCKQLSYSICINITNLILQNGLKLHHTKLNGRRINVEVTCGGGGKSERRRQKIRERNEKLQQKKRTLQS